MEKDHTEKFLWRLTKRWSHCALHRIEQRPTTLPGQNICLLFGFYRPFIDLTSVIKQMATGEGGYSSPSAEQTAYLSAAVNAAGVPVSSTFLLGVCLAEQKFKITIFHTQAPSFARSTMTQLLLLSLNFPCILHRLYYGEQFCFPHVCLFS